MTAPAGLAARALSFSGCRMRLIGRAMRTSTTQRLPPPPKQRAPVYGSPEHRAWRAAVIARAGGRCQDCGAARVRLFADHVVELQDGGAPHDVANGRALCGACHTRKTARARASRTAQRPRG